MPRVTGMCVYMSVCGRRVVSVFILYFLFLSIVVVVVKNL